MVVLVRNPCLHDLTLSYLKRGKVRLQTVGVIVCYHNINFYVSQYEQIRVYLTDMECADLISNCGKEPPQGSS